MVDHIRTLLLNPSNVPGYRKVVDKAVDTVLPLFGISGDPSTDAVRVDTLLPLAYADDLSGFREHFDQRVTPTVSGSVYAKAVSELSPSGLYASVFGEDGWWRVSALFQSDDPVVLNTLYELRSAAASKDAPFALGAVLLTCAYRRLLLQGEE